MILENGLFNTQNQEYTYSLKFVKGLFIFA
jgi:hypothetical protein